MIRIIVVHHLRIPRQNKYPTPKATTSPMIPIIISAVELLSYFPIIFSNVCVLFKDHFQNWVLCTLYYPLMEQGLADGFVYHKVYHQTSIMPNYKPCQ